MKIGSILDLNRAAKGIFFSLFSRHPLTNEVERLAKAGAEHIEFTLDLLFSYSKARDIFSEERASLREAAKSLGLTYSFHLPTTGGFCIGSCWDGVRLGSVAWLKEFVEWARPLEPTGYVMHPKALEDVCGVDLGPMDGGWIPMRKVYEYFTDNVVVPRKQDSLQQIRSFLEPSKIFLENSEDADFSLLKDFPLKSGASVCMDVGHLYLWKRSVPDFIRDFRPVLRHVHLHDVVEDPRKLPWGRRDHRPLGTGMVHISEVLAELKSIGFAGAIVIEDYYQDPVASIRFLKRSLENLNSQEVKK